MNFITDAKITSLSMTVLILKCYSHNFLPNLRSFLAICENILFVYNFKYMKIQVYTLKIYCSFVINKIYNNYVSRSVKYRTNTTNNQTPD